MDKKTEQIAANLVAKYDAAAQREDLQEMQRIVDIVCASPNQPFKRAVLRQLAI